MRLELVGAAVALLALVPTTTQAAVFAPASLDHDRYAETYTFVADVGDGYAQVQLSVTNLGPGSGHGICRALFAEDGKQPWTANERVSSSKWGHRTTGDEEVLQVGPCRVRSNKSELQVTANLGDRQVQIGYPPLGKSERPPGHQLKAGDGTYESEILVPTAKATVTIRKRGEKEPLRKVGRGYADHSRSTTEPRAMARRWVRFRGLGENGRLLLGRETPDGVFEPVWIRRSDGSYQTLQRFSLVAEGESSGSPRFGVKISGDAPLEIRSGQLLFRYAPVEELGLLANVVKPFAGSPVTYTYRATLVGAGGEPIPGILEISLAEE